MPYYFLKGVKEFEARWIGWAGVNVPDEIGQKALTTALAEKVRSHHLILVPSTYFSMILNCHIGNFFSQFFRFH